MKKILLNRNLPSRVVKKIADFGLIPLLAPQTSSLCFPLADHPDMLAFSSPEFIVADESLKVLLAEENCIFDAFSQLELSYPIDTRYNARYTAEGVILRRESASPAIIENAHRIIDTAQGYAACSSFPVSPHALITADPSIKKACDKNNLDCLKIRPGHIGIPVYDYGFIGGAGFLYDNKAFFFGDARLHPDYREIHKFIQSYGVEEIFLSAEELFDFGGGVIF